MQLKALTQQRQGFLLRHMIKSTLLFLIKIILFIFSCSKSIYTVFYMYVRLKIANNIHNQKSEVNKNDKK